MHIRVIAMKTAQKALVDLWVLSTSVSVVCCIMTITFLMYVLSFGLNITEYEKATVVGIFVALSVIFAFGYWQVLKSLELYKNILEAELKDHPNVGSSSKANDKKEECLKFQSLQKLSKICSSSRMRRFSFPMHFQEEFCYHCNRGIFDQHSFASEGHDLLKTSLKVALLEKSNNNCLTNSGEIPILLHNCVKDLGDVIEHVKLLNNSYTKTDEGTTNTKKKSVTASKQMNIDDEFMEENGSKESELQYILNSKKYNDIESNALDAPSESSEKHIQHNKTDSSYPVFQNLEASRLLRENLCSHTENISEGLKQEFLSKRIFISTDEIEPFLLKIPSDNNEFRSMMNLESEPSTPKEKISIQFYKRNSQIKQTPKSIVKKCISKLPLKPCMLKIPMRQYVMANSRKIPLCTISMSESAISKDLQIIPSKVPIISSNEEINSNNAATLSENLPITPNKAPILSVDELLMSMNETLNAHINEPLITSMNEPLITKFDSSDLENFADRFNVYADYCSLYHAK